MDAMEPSGAGKRADARRNEQALLDAAARVFVRSGVDAPVRAIAVEAGVGVGTIYRHFPTRADLVVAVYRHQIDACADAGPALLARRASPYSALTAWVDLFVDFLTTKHGLPEAIRDDPDGADALHELLVERLVPVCDELLAATRRAKEVRRGVSGYALLRGIGNLCIGGGEGYDARAMVALLVRGLRV